jgi:hypothetical protein
MRRVDRDGDFYTPSADTETTHLQEAVETARKLLGRGE